jgi:zinc/manganese transport system substrate-binding protein
MNIKHTMLAALLLGAAALLPASAHAALNVLACEPEW